MSQQPVQAGQQHLLQPVWWATRAEKSALNSESGKYSFRDVFYSLQERHASSRACKTSAAELHSLQIAPAQMRHAAAQSVAPGRIAFGPALVDMQCSANGVRECCDKVQLHSPSAVR